MNKLRIHECMREEYGMNLDRPYSSQHANTLQRACTQNVRAAPQTPATAYTRICMALKKHPPQTGVPSTLHAQARTLNRRRDTSAHIRAYPRQGEYSMDLDILYSPQKMHIHPRMHVYADLAAMTLQRNSCRLWGENSRRSRFDTHPPPHQC